MPLHIRLREAIRRLRRRLAAPVEQALRAELSARVQDWARERAELERRHADALAAALAAARADARSDTAALATATEAARRDLLLRVERLEGIAEEARHARREAGRASAALEMAVAALAEELLAPPSPPPVLTGRPRVSVILPTRDRRALALQAIASVQAQTFGDWELLVIDDGSRDGTAEALAPLLADDPRIRLLRAAGGGQCAARNTALREARGELVAYLDDDNRWFPGFLQGVVPTFDEDPALESAYGVIVADSPYFWGSRILFQPFDRAALLEANFIDLGAFVHRRRLFEELGGFDEQLTRLVDWDLILRYTERRPARGVPVLATYYRTQAADRITLIKDVGPNLDRIRRKWQAETPPAPPTAGGG